MAGGLLRAGDRVYKCRSNKPFGGPKRNKATQSGQVTWPSSRIFLKELCSEMGFLESHSNKTKHAQAGRRVFLGKNVRRGVIENHQAGLSHTSRFLHGGGLVQWVYPERPFVIMENFLLNRLLALDRVTIFIGKGCATSETALVGRAGSPANVLRKLPVIECSIDSSEGGRVFRRPFSLGIIGRKQHRPRTDREGRFQMHHNFAPSQQVYQSSETAMTSLQPGPH
ncbi:hypothetical protein H101_04133 [Trichophyton interdigitale H6]|nr:hypothetical protein H101_04133 [Trichophyton interdigitale H6]